MLGDGNTNFIERELDDIINCPDGLKDFEFLPNRENSSQKNEIKNIDYKTGPIRQDGLLESFEILSNKMNA